MNNYTYIIASVPDIASISLQEGGDVVGMLDWIMSQLDGKGHSHASFLMKGFETENLDAAFYEKALKSGNRFIREYFATDIRMRNTKVEYLNKAIGRPSGQDILTVDALPESDEMQAIRSIFTQDDLLAREKSIDNYMWHKADEITVFEYFSLDKILSIMVKLCMIRRWRLLDEEKGRQMLRTLAKEVRGSFGKIEFETQGK